MKFKYILPLLAGASLLLGGCKKEGSNIFNMFEGVTLTMNNNDPTDIVDYKLVKDGDVVTFDFTITSEQDMYSVSILEVGTSSPIKKFDVDAAHRHSFSGSYSMPAINRCGITSYRIYANDKVGYYLGDGHKQVTVDMINNFDLLPEKHVLLADTAVIADSLAAVPTPAYKARPTATSFYSFDDVKAYNYADAQAKSDKIDIGIWAKLTLTKQPSGVIVKTWNYYAYVPSSVAANYLPFADYNFSTWTKRAVKLGGGLTGMTNDNFAKNYKTGTQIITLAKASSPALTQSSVEIKAQGIFYFLNPEGRYGAVFVDKIGWDRVNGFYANFFIKYAYKQ